MGGTAHAREPLRCGRVRHLGSRSAGRGKRLLARGRADARPSPPAVKKSAQSAQICG